MTNTLQKQKFNINEVKRVVSNFKKDPKSRHNLHYFQARLTKLTGKWQECEKLHWETTQAYEKDKESYEDYMNDYNETEQLVEEYEGLFHAFIEGLKPADQKSNNDIANQTNNRDEVIRLERLKLPQFAGQYQDWMPFRDMYCVMVHDNNQLNDTQKMQYLKSTITGAAAEVIKHLAVTGANYGAAWELLKKRFENKGAIAHALVRNFCNIKPCQPQDPEGIKSMLNTTNGFISSLENLQIDILDLLILHLLEERLDLQSKIEWQRKIAEKTELPIVSEFTEFLHTRILMLESLDTTPVKRSKVATLSATVQQQCLVCSESHSLNHCNKFITLDPTERRQITREQQACFNCLRKGHSWRNCTSKGRCKECNRSHHSLLHLTGKAQQDDEKNNKAADGDVQVNHAIGSKSNILLATAMVEVENKYGTTTKLRALIDQGAQRSMITNQAAEKLGQRRHQCQYVIHGVGNTSITPKGVITARIKEKWTSKIIEAEFIIVGDQITKFVPAQSFTMSQRVKVPEGDLADETFSKSSQIDMLIGADLYGTILLPGLIKGHPTFQKTTLGWIISGPVSEEANTTTSNISLVSVAELNKTLSQFWEQEEVPVSRMLTPEEEAAEEHYHRYTTRKEDGRYVVRLPFKENPNSQLANNTIDAIIKYEAMERRLMKNEKLYEEYNNCLREYLYLNQMEEVSATVNTPCYYMPHHAVVKDTSSTTKVRVVFNASSKTPSGRSLNDILMVGPTIQDTLVDILLRWRMYPVVLMADIEKMYRQVEVHPSDRNFQRIVWRPAENDVIRHYQMKTVTFGTASAPFQAIRTLHKLAGDEEPRFPEAVKYLMRDFYVDDFLTGTDDEESAIALQNEMTRLLAMAGFKLRKWNPNNATVLQHIKAGENFATDPIRIQIEETTKTLGLHWIPQEDNFTFTVTDMLEDNEPITKRVIVSKVARLFDPLGWLQPVVITGKILIQQLWLEKCDWDDEVTPECRAKWCDYLKNIQALQDIRIPRWMGCSSSTTIELHGFCDASQQAMAAAIYLRTTAENEKMPIVRLLVAKTKVAPVQTQSIPRLELSSAVLLVKLMNQVKGAIKTIETVTTHFWTDSTDVLAWLRKHPSHWETYVANRVSKIQASSEIHQWHHINTEDNPADCATKGLTSIQLKRHLIWWNGASRLQEPSINFIQSQPSWMANTVACISPVDDPVTPRNDTNEDQYKLLERYSSSQRLFRIVAWCRRLVQKQKQKYIGVDEMRKAKTVCIKLSQMKYFGEDVEALSKRGTLPKASRLWQLNPYLDLDGVLRVGGRLQKSQLSQAAKHPVILHPKCHLTKLLVREVHQITTLHGTPTETLSASREQYWILNAQSLIKSTIHQCLICCKANAQTKKQLMGILPRERVTPNHAFYNTGLDFAGPITVKWSSGRGAKTMKAYLAIFICLTTKAFHLELVSELTSKACIASIKRFVSRRGKCKNLFSDNATNFVGASRELKQDYENMIYESQAEVVNDQIIWHFIPPSSPHFGGLWEAGVKSVKRHLLRSIGEKILNMEQMYTVLSEVEACLNSRPLTPISNDPNDHEGLTPGHFLIGRSMFAVPRQEQLQRNLSNKWSEIEEVTRSFWKRWQAEYLQRLQERPKWLRPQRNLEIGQLVLVKNEDLPATKWPLARIEDVHPGADELVRVVSIRYANGNRTKRHVTKLCPLPIPFTQTKEEETIETMPSTELKKPTATTANATITTNGKSRKRKNAVRSTISPWMYVLCLVACCIPSSIANLTTTRIASGTYIEQIGQVQMQHGTLRLDLRVPWQDVLRDEEKLKKVNEEMVKICDYQQEAAHEIHCQELKMHLVEDTNEALHKIQTLRLINGRTKRGLFGKMLTAVFGVNDEAYTDIANLAQNQMKIVHTTQQQGKLLLKAMQTMNATNGRIEQQFNKFSEQLKERYADIQKLRNRVTAIDSNYIKIQLLSSYQLAKGLVGELHDKYETILNTMYTRNGLLDCLEPAEVLAVINKTERILPSNLRVYGIPMNRLDIDHTEDHLGLSGYLMLVDVVKCDLVKISDVPGRIRDNLFSSKSFQPSIFAVRSDQQLYYEITESELGNALRPDKNTWLLQASVSYDFGVNPNCIIKEVYGLHQGRRCPHQTFRLEKPVWKQLNDHNMWIVVTPSPTTIFSICNNEREELVIHDTTLINLSETCSIQTAEFTLMPDIHQYGEPMKVWFKSEDTNFNISTIRHDQALNISMIWFHETYSDYIQEASSIDKKFSSFEWKTIIKHHSIPIVSIICLIAILITATYVWKPCTKLISKSFSESKTTFEQHQPKHQSKPISWREIEATTPSVEDK